MSSQYVKFFIHLFFFLNYSLANAHDVVTHHYDNLRSGWNRDESFLRPSNVSSKEFGLLNKVDLDDQVDAQPLILNNAKIDNKTFQIVYVVTESNTIYAINADTGQILLKRTLGNPVKKPFGCENSGANLGINSTPIIDSKTNTIYVMAYIKEPSGNVFRLYALDVSTLKDRTPSVIVAGKAKLEDGTEVKFDPAIQRQRAALLLNNNNIYAAFTSYCDQNRARGWLFGWHVDNEKIILPFDEPGLMNRKLANNNMLLSTIWMSGSGIASDQKGDIYFVTGNSDSRAYDEKINLSESVVKIDSSLTKVLNFYTPDNYEELEKADLDFGSGGISLISINNKKNLAIAAGKDGNMHILDQKDLSRLAGAQIGWCNCKISWYVRNKIIHIISSGKKNLESWLFNSELKSDNLFSENYIEINGKGLDNGGGFFTTVSSDNNGMNAIIWAINKDEDRLLLMAFDPESNLNQIFEADAGIWVNDMANPNTVPVVSNGKVYVASYKQLVIFGLKN